MLILGRKPGESVYTDNNIKVTVVSNDGHEVKLGFEAPDGVGVHREELYERIVLEKGIEKENN